MADGKVTDAEVKTQEERVVTLMKEIEPQLEPKLHERVTELLCELTAYDMMQSLNMMQSCAAADEVSRLSSRASRDADRDELRLAFLIL